MWVKDCTPLDGGTVISKQLSACMLPALTNMNSLVNTERSVIRALEPVLAVGSCRLALTSFDQQLYELHLGLAQTAAGISVADRNYFTEGLQTIHSASAVVATSTATTLPKACVYAPTQF
jgi:hypothetical protein